MNEDISITINGTLSNYRNGEHFLQSIQENFRVKNIPPKFSNFDGIYPLDVTFHITKPILVFLSSFILREAGKYVVKEFLLKPFFEELEKLETFNEEINVGYFTFEYEDVIVKVGYSRKNHLNVVSLLNIELLKKVPKIRALGLGNLNLITTPVIWNYNEWKFYENPKREITFNDFLQNWGLEFNELRRALYQLKLDNILYEHWWD